MSQEHLKDFVVKFFIAMSGNTVKDVTDEEMMQLAE